MADPPSQNAKDTDVTKVPAMASKTDPPPAKLDDDSDPDLDDLDDVLDQFSANAPQHPVASSKTTEPIPASSGPGRPAAELAEPRLDTSKIIVPEGQASDESEEQFMARLSAEMSSIMSKMAEDPSVSSEATPEDIAKMGKELEEFTYKMEAEGIKPEDLLRAIMGEDMGTQLTETLSHEKERRLSTTTQEKPDIQGPSKSKSPSSSRPSSSGPGNKSFEDTIRRTMARMEDSSAKATTSATQSTNNPLAGEEDLIAEMLKALESAGGPGAGDDGTGESADELSKMFLGMMEQLTNKEMLYEPMKELSGQFPKWLQDNKPPIVSQTEHDRFSRQHQIVKEIVAKFEERNYSDDDPKCREFVWEKMQKMQAEGAPPEELVANPMGMGMPGLGGGGGGGSTKKGGGGKGIEGMEGMEEGCPTQ